MLDVFIVLKGIWLFIIGLSLGSFAGVVVARQGKLWGGKTRSSCDHCQNKLAWFDNLPVFSFLWLRGRCRSCRQKISRQYPVMEMVFGVIFVIVAWRDGFLAGLTNSQTLLNTIFHLTIAFILLTIAWWDWRKMIIPDGLVFGGWLLAFCFDVYRYLISPLPLFSWSAPLFGSFLGAVLAAGFLYLLFAWSNGRWLGGGDVKLAFLLGFLVGWRKVYWLLSGAYILGAIWAIFLLFTGRASRKSKMPFGPFLVAAYFLLFLFEN